MADDNVRQYGSHAAPTRIPVLVIIIFLSPKHEQSASQVQIPRIHITHSELLKWRTLAALLPDLVSVVFQFNLIYSVIIIACSWIVMCDAIRHLLGFHFRNECTEIYSRRITLLIETRAKWAVAQKTLAINSEYAVSTRVHYESLVEYLVDEDREKLKKETE